MIQNDSKADMKGLATHLVLNTQIIFFTAIPQQTLPVLVWFWGELLYTVYHLSINA
jgi:hypothetical protein